MVLAPFLSPLIRPCRVYKYDQVMTTDHVRVPGTPSPTPPRLLSAIPPVLPTIFNLCTQIQGNRGPTWNNRANAIREKKAQLNPANYYRTKLNHLVYVKLIPVGELWINKYCKWFIVTCCRCVHVVPLHFIHDTHAMPSRINGMGAGEGLMGGDSWHANCILSLFRLVWSIFMTNYRRKTKEIVTTFEVGAFCWILLGLAGGRSCEWRF